jgi:hypothetical protein
MVTLMTETVATVHDLRLIKAHYSGGKSCHCLQVEQREGESYSGGTIRQRRDWQNCLSKGLLQKALAFSHHT